MCSEKIGKAYRLSHPCHSAVIMYMCFLTDDLQMISCNQENCLFRKKYHLYKEVEETFHSSIFVLFATHVFNKN